MSARHARILFLLLIVLVTLLFFVHVPNGGFQSKNGPTTPVNNLRFLAVCLLLLVACKLSPESPVAVLLSWGTRLSAAPLYALHAFAGSTSLRC